jgi:broad specificity phosphatase PhoE
MEAPLPVVCLARHGETAWSITGQHTGLTDLPLTEQGDRNARRLGQRLSGQNYRRIFTSPLKRATRTCELAGFGNTAEVDRLLVEWNYGKYEGRSSAEIRRERPDWDLFLDGAPGGETPEDVSTRADRVIERIRAIQDNVLLFSSGHFLRVLATRWLNLEASMGRHLLLSTASLSVLGYEHDLLHPVIQLWNDTDQFALAQ